MPDVYKRKGSPFWWYDFSVDGERHRRSTRTTEKRLAEDIAAKADGIARTAAVHGKEAVLTFPQIAASYVADEHDSRFIEPLVNYFRKWKIKDIAGPDIRKAAKIIYPNAAAATWNRQVITPMRAILNHYLEANGKPKISVTRFEETKKMRPAGTKQWVDAFCKAAEELQMWETAAMARFLFSTAARVSEACRLEWDDVDLDHGIAILRETKNGEPRTVFLTAEMLQVLRKMPVFSKLVFAAANRSTVKKRFEKVIAHAGLARLTSHEIGRHGFATEMIVRNGVDIATTADRGGWKSRRILMENYAEGNADREVIDRVFGKK